MIRKSLSVTALAALVAMPLVVGSTDAAAASCHSRKATGTVLGGLGGALLGNSISHGGGGAVIGGLGGAVIGHQIGKSGCNDRRAYYSRHRTTTAYRNHNYRSGYAARTYYDERGNPVVVR
jgi:uncharacterized protein YcfJ